LAQNVGIAIEPVALGATPAPLAAAFPSQGAADSTAQQSQKAVAAAAAKVSAAAAQASAVSDPPPAAEAQAVSDSINAEWLASGKSLELSVDLQSDRSVVIVRDTVTGDVIGQFPTEQVLRQQSLFGSQPHLLIDTTV
jgi:uncharacterized FlaG/YvyC family protein